MSYLIDYAPILSRTSYHKRSRRKRRGLSRAWQNRLAALVLVACVLSGLATYAAMTETPPLGNDPNTVLWLLNLNLVLMLMLGVFIARRIVSLWSGRKRGIAGSDLHVRLVYIFSLMAALPAIIMTVFSAFFFHFGVQTWFSDRVATAVNESQAVAQAYLEEHKQVIRADVMAMAGDLDRQSAFLLTNEQAFERIMQTQSMLRNLSEAIVFDSSGRVLARSGLTFSLEFTEVPPFALNQANEGEVVIMTGGNDDRVRALIKLGSLMDTYLFVGRMVDPQVLSHLTATKQASQDYADLQSRYSNLQITVTMIFVVVGLLLMLAAIWLGLLLARQLVSPISDLITTADRVRAGDFTARVPDQGRIGEFDYLAQSFNRMTRQIQEQQGELMDANRQLDRRRRFTETILAGVSSGVIGVDAGGVINMVNSSARELMGKSEDEALEGQSIAELIPEIRDILEKAHKKPGKITQAEIPMLQADGAKRTFLVRIAIELIGAEDVGAILTFDDITELQSAQRKAAWADVARRIAHEIKNPLTPIQLSAERLRRKYLSQISQDPETFEQCTETIIRHVADIGHMVNEFSSFARMPEPVMKPDNLLAHVKDTLVLHRQAHSDISFHFMAAPDQQELRTAFDSQQIRQALNNLIQNAVDSVQSRMEQQKADGKKVEPGAIDITMLTLEDDEIAIAVSDNGLGLPKNEPSVRLTEPYVTHKPKGTGLGLAIVKKIMEDHNGKLVLGSSDWLSQSGRWRDLGGATVLLVLPVYDESDSAVNDGEESAQSAQKLAS